MLLAKNVNLWAKVLQRWTSKKADLRVCRTLILGLNDECAEPNFCFKQSLRLLTKHANFWPFYQWSRTISAQAISIISIQFIGSFSSMPFKIQTTVMTPPTRVFVKQQPLVAELWPERSANHSLFFAKCVKDESNLDEPILINIFLLATGQSKDLIWCKPFFPIPSGITPLCIRTTPACTATSLTDSSVPELRQTDRQPDVGELRHSTPLLWERLRRLSVSLWSSETFSLSYLLKVRCDRFKKKSSLNSINWTVTQELIMECEWLCWPAVILLIFWILFKHFSTLKNNILGWRGRLNKIILLSAPFHSKFGIFSVFVLNWSFIFLMNEII